MKKLAADGMSLSQEIRARLSPLIFDHINFHGFYPFIRPDGTEKLRPFHNVTDGQPTS